MPKTHPGNRTTWKQTDEKPHTTHTFDRYSGCAMVSNRAFLHQINVFYDYYLFTRADDHEIFRSFFLFFFFILVFLWKAVYKLKYGLYYLITTENVIASIACPKTSWSIIHINFYDKQFEPNNLLLIRTLIGSPFFLLKRKFLILDTKKLFYCWTIYMIIKFFIQSRIWARISEGILNVHT